MKKSNRDRISYFFKPSLIMLLASGLCAAAYALDYLGASNVLRQVEERIATPGEKTATDEQSKLRDELKAFSQTTTNLAPADAAKQWLELVDRAMKLQQQSSGNYNPSIVPLQPDDLLDALPPPATWSELAKAIAARPPAKGGGEAGEIGLHLLAATLNDDAEGRNREIVNLQTKAKTADNQAAYFYRNLLEQISRTMLAMSDDPDAILKSLAYQLNSAGGGRRGQNLNVPNLVPQIGTEKAEAFLRQALVTPNVVLVFSQPNETSRLAQKLAMELLPQLKTPQWGLVNSLDAVDLYEALDKRFPAPTNNAAALPLPGLANVIPDMTDVSAGNDMDDNQKNQAQIYYMLGLISHDRTKDAVVIAKKLNSQSGGYYFDEAFKSMQRAGFTAELDNFFYELLSQNPTLPFWDEYVELAANAGQTDRMIALVRSAIARDDLSDGKKASLHQILFKALLAADNVDEAVSEMRQLIAAGTTAQSADSYNNGQLGALLARIGLLLNKPEWTEEGITVAKKWLATTDGQNFSGGEEAQNVLDSTVQTLFELQRGPEAESLLTDALTSTTRAGDAQPEYSWNSPPAREILAELATLYHQAGRSQDVLNLLQQAPTWGAGDLSDLFESSPWGNQVSVMWLHTGSSPTPVPYLAADALLAAGQKEQARKITDALLDHYPGLDRGYELLLALDGTNAIPRLDELFARDQFEERPLIWKAHLLGQQGQLEEAEKIARQAISIDPSDGEEGRGDRMRVYAELADIREARGDQKDADFYREIVKAIRLSEDADQFYAAGLLKHAIAMYEEGLKHFSDAYCIQSRLAIQESALGLNAEAEEHYRRAYELMPDSFGRVESHCFGCEKVFDGEHAQSIAEKVFTQLAVERPDKPQVHYLLGYLRFEQERYNEALTNFLTAVKLDPDYLNAWVKAQEASEQTLVPPKERDEIALNILRLDPLNRHASANFSQISDLTGLWNAVAAAESRQPVAATNLLALTASKAALEKKQSSSVNQSRESQMMERMQEGNRATTPASAVAQTPFVQLAGQMILNSNSSGDE